jgi:hypothetical protein
VGSFRYFRHPRVNGADRAAAAMYCINGPRSPEKYKREVAWSYSQGAPGAFAGDLNYYNIEDDRGTNPVRADRGARLSADAVFFQGVPVQGDAQSGALRHAHHASTVVVEWFV